jgi:hypothetical protein
MVDGTLEYDFYYLKPFSVLRDIGMIPQTFCALLLAEGGRRWESTGRTKDTCT